jgi:hypothetical protein
MIFSVLLHAVKNNRGLFDSVTQFSALPLNRRELLRFVAYVSDHILVVVIVDCYIVIRQLLPLEDTLTKGLCLVSCVRAEHLDVLVGSKKLRSQELYLRL